MRVRRGKTMRTLRKLLVLSAINLLAFGLLNCAGRNTESPIPTLASTQIQKPNPVKVVEVPVFIGKPIQLPDDDAGHPGVATEWWYYNGHLGTEDGKKFDFHYVVFSLIQPNLSPLAIAHLGIGDVQEGAYFQGQRVDLISAASLDERGFGFDLHGWTMSGFDGNDKLKASLEDYEVDLEFKPLRPPVLHSEDGILDFAQAGTSYYYSRTRQEISGKISVRGVDSSVSGIGWFDHQWGNFAPREIGWDWFSLQFVDGTELMITVLRDKENQTISRYGTFLRASGISSYLTREEIEVEPLDCWVSTLSGISYPIRWNIKIPRYSINLVLDSRILESEFNSTATTGNYYWEGSVGISGTQSGEGFVELAGYLPHDSTSSGIGKNLCDV
jgi:predicted secreted hydrolase